MDVLKECVSADGRSMRPVLEELSLFEIGHDKASKLF